MKLLMNSLKDTIISLSPKLNIHFDVIPSYTYIGVNLQNAANKLSNRYNYVGTPIPPQNFQLLVKYLFAGPTPWIFNPGPYNEEQIIQLFTAMGTVVIIVASDFLAKIFPVEIVEPMDGQILDTLAKNYNNNTTNHLLEQIGLLIGIGNNSEFDNSSKFDLTTLLQIIDEV